ncbi:MAG: hypothetical protein WCE23_00595 [Candidatus Binatus sp.]|uniref:hypothetical protein n=1 Tax=Candidatus Binatus sp. TaxID=2811406 RepID=UPI003C70808B
MRRAAIILASLVMAGCAASAKPPSDISIQKGMFASACDNGSEVDCLRYREISARERGDSVVAGQVETDISLLDWNEGTRDGEAAGKAWLARLIADPNLQPASLPPQESADPAGNQMAPFLEACNNGSVASCIELEEMAQNEGGDRSMYWSARAWATREELKDPGAIEKACVNWQTTLRKINPKSLAGDRTLEPEYCEDMAKSVGER